MNRKRSFIRNYAEAGFFFPAANVFNFSQGGNPVVIGIAIANFAYSTIAISTRPLLKNKYARYLPDPLLVTACSTLLCGGLLLGNAAHGSGKALFPGLTSICFGLGSYIQTSPSVTKFRTTTIKNTVMKSAMHPAVWYGLGYTMTGIGIGGGLSLLAAPVAHPVAAFLTAIGIIETVGALGLMILGKVKNLAAPFIGVACGTLFFAATGAVTHNLLGVATGLFACAGELSLAALMQKLHQANYPLSGETPASHIESFLTYPLREAMKRGWIDSTP